MFSFLTPFKTRCWKVLSQDPNYVNTIQVGRIDCCVGEEPRKHFVILYTPIHCLITKAGRFHLSAVGHNVCFNGEASLDVCDFSSPDEPRPLDKLPSAVRCLRGRSPIAAVLFVKNKSDGCIHDYGNKFVGVMSRRFHHRLCEPWGSKECGTAPIITRSRNSIRIWCWKFKCSDVVGRGASLEFFHPGSSAAAWGRQRSLDDMNDRNIPSAADKTNNPVCSCSWMEAIIGQFRERMKGNYIFVRICGEDDRIFIGKQEFYLFVVLRIGGPDLRVQGAVAVPLIAAREGAEILGPILWTVTHDRIEVVGCCPDDGLQCLCQCAAQYQRLLEVFPTTRRRRVNCELAETSGDNAGDADKIAEATK